MRSNHTMFINLQGLIVLLVAGALSGLVHLVVPFLHLPHRLFGLGLALFAVGVVAQGLKIHPRLFFLSPWVLGWLMLGIGVWQRWGWLAGSATIGSLAVLALGITVLIYAAEQKSWNEAPAALAAAQEALVKGDHETVWTQLQAAACFPNILPMTPEMHAHNRKLVGIMTLALGEIPQALTQLLANLDALLASQEAGKSEASELETAQLLSLFNHLLVTKGDLESLGITASEAPKRALSEKEKMIQAMLAKKTNGLPSKHGALPAPPPDRLRDPEE